MGMQKSIAALITGVLGILASIGVPVELLATSTISYLTVAATVIGVYAIPNK